MARCPGEIVLNFEQLLVQIVLGHKVETPKSDEGLKYKPVFETESHKTIHTATYDGLFQPHASTEEPRKQ